MNDYGNSTSTRRRALIRRTWSAVSIALLLALFGCSTATPPSPAVVTEIVELPDPTPVILPPDPLRLEPFEWTVFAPGYWRDPEAVYFCLDPSQYEILARNNGQVLRFTQEVMWQLRYYRQDRDENAGSPGDDSSDD